MVAHKLSSSSRPRLRGPRAREALLAFEALSIEGGLLSPDWLARAAQLDAGGQSEADYRIPRGLNLRDEIGRYWRIAQAHWSDFAAGRAGNAHPRHLAEHFVLALLRESFGFASLRPSEPIVLDERHYPVGFSALGGRVPVVVAPAGSGLDTLAPAYGDGTRRRSAFGLVQEHLNAVDGALWGLASDGLTLRIVRDNASLTRPAWVEADLQRIFVEERFADFAALWLLAHETRFGRADQPVTECALETWRDAGREEGTRAREHLRRGVEDAIMVVGQGFLAHPDNQALRSALHSGALTTNAYFNQLLRLAYRLIFLLTVEERGLLHPDGTADETRRLYAEGYSLRRLCERSLKRSAHDRYSDLWEATKIVFRGVTAGEPQLGLPALAGIFARTQCPALDAAKLENRALLLAVFKLAWLRDNGSLARVNWRDMGPEELGSVYESLLELVPQISKDGRQFAFATGSETRGNARKTSGSYYTPDSLVQVLLDSALEPVIAETIARNPGNPVEALLALSIVDPACGSGHFLLAAARRLAAHVARLVANGTPSATEYRHALRQVVGHCIHGVDLNPMAVELCKVSLWMEAVEPGLPLAFLNSHIQHGNALIGTTPELMASGLPDKAWDPIEGDDKKTASALKKRNKKAAEGQSSLDTLWSTSGDAEARAVARAVAELEAASDANVEALAKKETKWDGILDSPEYLHQKTVADAWCAAFIWPKKLGELADAAPTSDLWWRLRDGHGQTPTLTTKTVRELAEQYRFFHWHLQFPQVFAKGGFDVVLGNPPWERVKLQEQEFFASRSDEIAGAENAAARKKLIAKLADEDPALWAEWAATSRQAAGSKHFLRESGRYPLCGQGDVNTYALFAEHNRQILSKRGAAGFIVPTGLATDDSTSDFFSSVMSTQELSKFLSFENEDRIFPSVHHAFKFALLVIDRAKRTPKAEFMFFARRVADVHDPERRFALTPKDLEALCPHTWSAPTFRSRRDAELVRAIHIRLATLRPKSGSAGWECVLRRMIHMADDAESFKTAGKLLFDGWDREGNVFVREGERMLPLYEAKLVHHFNHRFSTYEGQTEAQGNQGKCPELSDYEHGDPAKLIEPRYWIAASDVDARLAGDWERGWVLGWRDICRSVDQRTMIASVIPRAAFAGFHQIRVYSDPRDAAALYACLCSFIADYTARQKVGGTHLTYGILEQVPVIPPATLAEPAGWSGRDSLRCWLLPRVLELTYTAWDLEPFARDVGYHGPPFRWDPERRFLLRAELDAAFFHLYGLSRDDTGYVMDTFPIVRKNEEKAHGEFRTKCAILGVYDAMAEAIRTGKPYQTRLNPSPANSAIAHPSANLGLAPVQQGAKVIPLFPPARFRPQVQPAVAILSAPDLSAVGRGDWARPRTHESAEITAVIIAVLKAAGAPVEQQLVRLAALFCLEPHLLGALLEDSERTAWTRAVGVDAQKTIDAAIDGTTEHWGGAVSKLRGRGTIVEELPQGSWRLGSGFDAIYTRGWPDGRAGFVVSVLRGARASARIDSIVIEFPTVIREWVKNAV